jgi:hypothetical protein
MMLITTESVLMELQKAVPSFRMDPDWLLDKLTYPAFNDFARFICSEGEVLQFVSSKEEGLRLSKIGDSMAFLERALQEGDSSVHRLVFECIETLASCEWINHIKEYFGPGVSALWCRHFQ